MPRIRQSLLYAATAALAAGMIGVPGPVTAAVRLGAAQVRPNTAPVTWSARLGPVPRAVTTRSPALTSIVFPGIGLRQLLLWAGPGSAAHGFRVSYEFATSLDHNRWSAAAQVDGGIALTSARPSAAPYGGTARKIIAVWKGSPAVGKIWYSIGTGETGGKVSWSAQLTIPGTLTSGGPAVYALLHSRVVFVTWQVAGSSAIDYVLGSPVATTGAVSWGPVRTVPGAEATSTPAVAEASTGHGAGRLNVFWKGPGDAGRIDYATTHVPLSGDPRWTDVTRFPADRTTGAPLAAEAIGPGSTFPLLVVYRARHSAHLLYLTLARNGSVSRPREVPDFMSDLGPVLYRAVLAATAPDRRIYFHICGGC
jgi:hypothetical protein